MMELLCKKLKIVELEAKQNWKKFKSQNVNESVAASSTNIPIQENEEARKYVEALKAQVQAKDVEISLLT